MERFLRYSLEKGRKIRAMLMLNGQLQQRTVTVLALTPESAVLSIRANKPPITVPITDIFSCDYARGDHGED